MYWSLQQPVGETESNPDTPDESSAASIDNENETSLAGEVSNLDIDDSASDSLVGNEQSSQKSENDENEESSPKVEGQS